MPSSTPELCPACGAEYATKATANGKAMTWRVVCQGCGTMPDAESTRAPRYRQPDIVRRPVRGVGSPG